MRIITARPSPEDEDHVPHRLYGVLSAKERCSVGFWREMALREIEKANKKLGNLEDESKKVNDQIRDANKLLEDIEKKVETKQKDLGEIEKTLKNKENEISNMSSGSRIELKNGHLVVPNNPTIPFIQGDGIGPDIWRSSVRVLDAAVERAYQGDRKINWLEVYAGQKAFDKFNNWLPDETIQSCREFLVSIKGPLTTPIGGGIRSLNVALRQALDLYVCLRPVRWFRGVPSPVREPENVDMVIFRENTEDIYAGIEFEQGSDSTNKFLHLFKESFPDDFRKIRFPKSSGIGIKPISREGSERLLRSAFDYAITNQRKSITLVHKGNIMKFTEGAFRNWGYELAEREYGNHVYTWEQWEKTKAKHGEETDRIYPWLQGKSTRKTT